MVVSKPTVEKLTRYHIYVTIAGWLGWTFTAMDQFFFVAAIPFLMEEFAMTLVDVGLVFLGGFTVAGILTMFVIGPIMDRYGRRLMFQITVIGGSIGSVSSAFAWNFSSLLVLRSLTSGIAGSEWSTGQTIIAETVPVKYRARMIGWAQIGWPLGQALSFYLGVVVIPLYTWRGLFLLGGLLALLVILIRTKVKETDRFLDMKRIREAAKRREKIEARYEIRVEEAVKMPYRQLLKPESKGGFLRQIVGVGFGNWASAVQYVGIQFYIATYGIEIRQFPPIFALFLGGVLFTIVAAMYFAQAGLGDRIGPREALIVFHVIGGALFVPTFLLDLPFETFVVMLMISSGFALGVWSGWIRLFTESFPTRARGTGSSLMASFCYWGTLVGGVIPPLTIAAWGWTWGWGILYGTIFTFIAVAFLLISRRLPARARLEEIAY